MKKTDSSTRERMFPLLLILAMLLISVLPAQGVQAAPTTSPVIAPTVTTIEIDAVDDAGTTSAVPTASAPNAYLVLNQRGDGSFDWNFIQFDLRVLPANATIDSAELHLNIYAAGGPVDVEVGRADGAWDELSLNWNNKPGVTWGGPVTTVSAIGDVSWPVKPLVSSWQNGSTPNFGLTLRGTSGTGAGVRADSKEWGVAPKLVITYSTPAQDGPRTDLGDAPDSTNHHGQNNTAYPGTGTPGQFPTVWDVPAGQVAGPRHRNVTLEGWLGTYISPETEADQGPDLDGPNNILRSAGGAIGDVADNDRGDDGWRNRELKFFNCQRATLDIRVSKDAAATRNFMYLNVWFDGNRDGDWQDLGQCQANENEPAQASYEWIVQNYIIDMTAIPAGGSYDFAVNTQKVFNGTEGKPHWMRFMLTDEPAVQPAEGGLPDGRGPHPTSPQEFYQFGETEDVIQKPPPAGEDGQLLLEKRVITNSSPVAYADSVIYEIRLRHNGGSQPIQAQIRDELDYPFHLLRQINDNGDVFLIDVSTPTGGVSPLQANLDYDLTSASGRINQVITWDGSLEPNAEVRLSFEVHIHPRCAANEQTVMVTNVAQARPVGGDAITNEASFEAACPGYLPDAIDIEPEPQGAVIDIDRLTHVQWQGTIRNRHDFPVTLGAVFEPNDANTATQAAQTGATSARPILERIALAANEERLVNLELRMESEFSDELALDIDFHVGGILSFCFLEDESTACPDGATYPNLVVEAPPVEIHYRPSDLGDAPDSTNHAAMPMSAYAGVQADFPTVFDASTGQPQGPRHRFPGPLHLGQAVSREAEADIGADQDPVNNILPTTDDPDNDRGDDGPVVASWNFNHCQQTVLQTQISVSPQAVNYFQNNNAQAYLNVWIDSNRDGDWGDVFDCNGQPSPEHILIDSPVNVVAMGAGLHTIGSQTGLVPWTITDKPAWVRVTLSERPANKTLQSGNVNYGDGRGYAQPFKTGETEDFYYRPLTAGGGPDIDVRMTAQTRNVTAQELGLHTAAANKLGNVELRLFKIDYVNRGSAIASGAKITITTPPALRNGELVIFKSPGIATDSFMKLGDIQGELMDLEPGRFGTIVLGWTGCLTCTVVAANTNVDITAAVEVALDGDIDSSNNLSSATARGLLSSPIIGLALPNSAKALCNNEVIEGIAVTNRTELTLQGRAAPNQELTLYDGRTVLGTVQSDPVGNFNYTGTFGEGQHTIYADYVMAPRDVASGLPNGKLRLFVKPSLPFDSSSLCFTDSQGHSYALPTLGWSFGVEREFNWLRSGETYRVSVSGLGNTPNQSAHITLNDLIITSLVDDDGDGNYTSLFVFPEQLQAANSNGTRTLGLIVNDGSSESRYSTDIRSATNGTIVDRGTDQPLADANVALLRAEEAGDSEVVYTTFAGQGDPQTTGSDGVYRFSADDGVYRIDVIRDGYQPYRTNDIDATESTVNQRIALSPQVPETTTHTVYLTANGFAPSTLTVSPGSVVEFINVDLEEHGIRNSQWDSGSLATGQSYKIKVSATGTSTFSDSHDALNGGTIIVTGGTPDLHHAIFLPLVQR